MVIFCPIIKIPPTGHYRTRFLLKAVEWRMVPPIRKIPSNQPPKVKLFIKRKWAKFLIEFFMKRKWAYFLIEFVIAERRYHHPPLPNLTNSVIRVSSVVPNVQNFPLLQLSKEPLPKMLYNRIIFNWKFGENVREVFKYYFADFVRKRGGGPPKSVTYFLDQNQVFFEQKTPFLALFEEKFSGENP